MGVIERNRDQIALALTVASLFALIELSYPLFFLKTDNRDYFFPLFSYNADSVSRGFLPVYNFHQFLGVAHLSSIQPATLYPPIYAAFWLSRIVFGSYIAGIDILVVTHFIAGALGVYCLLTHLRLSRESAFFGAVTWPLSSFLVYRTLVWGVIYPVAAYFPWMIFLSLRLKDVSGFKTVLPLALVRLLLFYSGYPQYFIYACIFEFLTVAPLYAAQPRGSLKDILGITAKYLGSYAVVLALAMPLLLPAWHQVEDSSSRIQPLRFATYISGPFNWHVWLPGLFFLTAGTYRTSNENLVSYLAYQGLFMPPLAAYALLRMRGLSGRTGAAAAVFILLAFFAFMWASSTTLQGMIYSVPILNRFRRQYKLYFFVAFYLALIAAAGFDLLLPHLKRLWKKAAAVLIALQAITLVCVYLAYPHYDISAHNGSRGHPSHASSTDWSDLAQTDPLDARLSGGRIFSFACGNGFSTKFYEYNYATMKGLYYFAGYEPLIDRLGAKKTLGLNYKACFMPPPGRTPPVRYLRTWGVRWYIVGAANARRYQGFFKGNNMKFFYGDRIRSVYYDGAASPMFFWRGSNSSLGLSGQVGVNTIRVTVDSDAGGEVVLNWLYRPFFRGLLDGSETGVLSDEHGRTIIRAPAGRHEITLTYTDPSFTAGSYAFAASAALLAVAWAAKSIIRKTPPRFNGSPGVR